MLLLKSKHLLLVVLAVVSLDMTGPAHSQVFDFDKDRMPIVEMRGMWRFHTGDDPGWAAPNFDDSGWALIRPDQNWNEQGYPGYSGTAWYRCKVLLPKRRAELAIYLPQLTNSFQVFANGRLIGQEGGLPPHEKVVEGDVPLYRIPDDAVRGDSVSIAVRVWLWPYWALAFPGGMQSPPRIGAPGLLQSEVNDSNNEKFWSLSRTNVLMLINLLAGLAGMALFALRPVEREYLWFGASEILTVLDSALWVYGHYYSHSFQIIDALSECLEPLSSLCFLAFIFTLLKAHKNWLYWTGFVAICCQLLLTLPGEILRWISLPTWSTVVGILSLPFITSILVALYQGTRRGLPDARLLLGPVAFSYGEASLMTVAYTINALGHPDILRYLGWPLHVFQWPFPFSVQNIADLLMQLSILAILLLRFARARHDEQRMTTELESARAVQNVLIPSDPPTVPGFDIFSVYRPASQVGGDFFQIIPTRNAGVFAVIGDVSGKGMPAAMTVSLLVGTVRTLAHYTQVPSEILAAMNQRMLARSAGGFTTCLVLRADSDGSLTVANAGHIAPYLNGKELPLENGLPLGLAADSIYIESTFHLAEGEQLTLMTDGIVEAMSKSGELFGFERTTAVACESAQSIAQAAQDFGQEDDITVLTINRLAVAKSQATRR